MTYQCEMAGYVLTIEASGLPEARRQLRVWAKLQGVTVVPAVWRVLDDTLQASATRILAPYKS